MGQPTGRSVDSKSQSRVIEPRKLGYRGSLRCGHSGGRTGTLYRPGVSGPAGVVEQGKGIVGFPGTWEVLVVSTVLMSGKRGPDCEPLACGLAFWAVRSKLTDADRGIATRRQPSVARGTQEVASPHSTVEAGEPGPQGPWGGKEAIRHGLVVGQPVEGWNLGCGSPERPRTAKRDGESMTKRTGCLNWARPDLWERRGVIPGATRPVSPGFNGSRDVRIPKANPLLPVTGSTQI